MKRALPVLLAAATAIAAVGLSACTPTSGRYIDQVFASTTMTTHLYKETTNLTTGAPLQLYTNVYQPVGDTLAKRPAIVWIHGGGFATGNRDQIGDVASEWARRGYVTLSISYRLDPGNKCQQIQDGTITDPVQLETETARCQRAIYAAQNDAFSALGWLRRHAAEFKVDTARLAVAGSSAGAVTALNVAQRGNVTGEEVPVGKSVKAALAMSGCQYDPASIDAEDAPIAMIASGGDVSVPYECSVDTVERAASFGTPTVASYWPAESYHAKDLYRRHQAEIDAAWTKFLYECLALTQP